jgi:hypothetical protein
MQKRQPRRRSDKVRRRLKEESTIWINKASRRITDPVSSSTSAAHGQSASQKSTSSQHAKKVNRLFRVGWRFLSFLLAGAFSFAILTAWQSPDYKVSTIRIEGLQRLQEDEVLSILDIYGLHIFALEPEKVCRLIYQHFPEFRDIQVKLSLPAQVSIRVVERQPVIAWQLKDNLLWIDSEGYLIPARGEANQMLTIQADALPSYRLINKENASTENVIRDKPKFKDYLDHLVFFSIPKQIDGNLLTAILQLNAWMPEESVLLYQEKRGIGWSDIRGWEGIQPSMVSVEFLHAPYFRLED